MGDCFTQEIAEAVANAKGIEVEQMELVLCEYIDPDAIETLAAHETASWTLSFDLPDHRVTITSEREIIVD